nr:ADP-ribosylglycohydrolase family protein [Lachnospiraceae bacterium]
YTTQRMSFAESRRLGNGLKRNCSWLLDVPALYQRRAPGNTCLSALSAQRSGKTYGGENLTHPANESKGCGGIMRVAPIALMNHMGIEYIDREAAEIAAITHGHSLGYMPAAVLAHIIHRIVFPESPMSLKEIILEARKTAKKLFHGDKHLKTLCRIIDLAVSLSENKETDIDNIYRLGEGWVAEETLGISIYCALRHQNDFSAGIIAAVNHKGDSDSTGAVTGNILGALLGYGAIEEKWKRDLELSNVILEVADDLCHGCQMDEFGHYRDPDWTRKYIYLRWKEPERLNKPDTPLLVVMGDIAACADVEAIVNSANEALAKDGSGVNGRIHMAAGPELEDECRRLGGCVPGAAKLTGAYRLPCKYVIHTVGPWWKDGNSGEADLLEACYLSCLGVAIENGIRNIAFPSLSTGSKRFPMPLAAEIAVKTVKKVLDGNPGKIDKVLWVVPDEKAFQAYSDAIRKWQEMELIQSPEFYEINRMLREGEA